MLTDNLLKESMYKFNIQAVYCLFNFLDNDKLRNEAHTHKKYLNF